MFKYNCLNPIADIGLELFTNEYERINNYEEADAILLRSADMHEAKLHKGLYAIARAGAGVNNIPIEKCSEEGIVVFNTPGANANGVKELVISGLLLASRDIVGGIEWVNSEKDNKDIAKLTEKIKKNFAGSEISGKKLGVIGLGAIGVLVANAATYLDMKVYGYDPYMSVDAAWNLYKGITHITDIRDIFQNCDYISIHTPLLDSTKFLINKEAIAQMKDGVVILNYARDLLVNEKDLTEALKSGKVKKYLSDFPNTDIMNAPNTLITPHLGASTSESEDNCAKMAVKATIDFLENGNIKNSVNFPNCDMGICMKKCRISIAHRNIKNMISQFTQILGDNDINIANMINKSKGDYAYSMFDVDTTVTSEIMDKIKEIEGVLKVRKLK
ncbi:phosphoglycerate dehydrogenase [Fusobacterium sp. PH5-44]|uniref:phosphoglycerate dehydrogenase n=1 Tax=unclassified Fusobacterium TaxID=2648384 RepID=UPI003D19E19F